MKYAIKIIGKTPYMQHRMDDIQLEEWEKNRGKIIERKDIKQEDLNRAIYHSYNDKEGYYFPTEHLRNCLINGGSFLKSKVGNSRKSMKNVVAAMISFDEEKIRLPEFDEIDKRSAVNNNIKARVIIVRPKWNKWQIDCVINVDNDTITKETLIELFSVSGNYVGVGSYRPTNNGCFGRFELKQIKKL